MRALGPRPRRDPAPENEVPTLDHRSLTERAVDDPWSLSPSERRTLAEHHRHEQRVWLSILRRADHASRPSSIEASELRDGSVPDDFPAFLLALGYCSVLIDDLERAILDALDPGEALPLDGAGRDRLEHFVELFRDWSSGCAATCPSGPAAGEQLIETDEPSCLP
jgi:hypothetical protein